MTKPVSLQIYMNRDEEGRLAEVYEYVLCDDGTVWTRRGPTWATGEFPPEEWKQRGDPVPDVVPPQDRQFGPGPVSPLGRGWRGEFHGGGGPDAT